MSDLTNSHNLSLQDGGQHLRSSCSAKCLWDVFEHSTALGGAPLNFAAHAKRLGYNPLLISAVGADSLGNAARQEIAALGLDTSFLQTTSRFPTGTARVELGPGDRTRFVIERPAAYDAICLREEQIAQIIQRDPGVLLLWNTVCIGASRPGGARQGSWTLCQPRLASTTSTSVQATIQCSL